MAFVLGGGGGPLGAHEVGMLAALAERGIVPDVVLGTSVGAINGAAFAAEPTVAGVERLTAMWGSMQDGGVFSGSLLGRVATLARTRTHLHDSGDLRELLAGGLGDARIEDLALRFQCVAASIERAEEHWFTEGPVVDAVLASASVPGLLPPAEVGGEHYMDGGIVNSIPVSRAVELGATRIFVLHVGRLARPLEPPRWPWEVGLVAFEIARRHRVLGDLAGLPEGIEAHVLPTGTPPPSRYSDLRYRDASRVAERIAGAREATAAYLEEHGL
jgi:NTE family protein